MKSLRVQLTATIAAVLGLGLGALLLIAGLQLQATTLEAFVHEKELSVLAISSSLPGLGDGDDSGFNSPTLPSRLVNSATQVGMEISLFNKYGDLLATTHSMTPEIDNAPEILDAFQGQVFHVIRDQRLFIAVPIFHEGKDVRAVLWGDTSTVPVDNKIRVQWIELIAASGVTLLIACGFGWGLASRIIHPLINVQRAALHMAKGNLNVRSEVKNASSELVQLSDSFNHMAQEVETLVIRHRDFVANAAHELRSPLASIKLRAESLLNPSIDPSRAHQYLRDINEETSRLAQLVGDLLQLSRIEGHEIAPPTEPIEVANELTNCIRRIRPRAAAKQQQLTYDIPVDLPDVFIHANELDMMVGNLLDNAVKYTPEAGHITLAAAWQDKTLTISVCDDGEGIPPADLDRVTERFFRVDRAHQRAIIGAGLGLAIVSAMAAQYGGQLILKSQGIPGQGTQATLQLRPRFSHQSS
ncbi:MAG: HAMP domain-containing histidine kinase [Anaerolineae bacterium]|nr:HAMP domain-containing histidine kinase [Anaerolineae bacterium]